MSATLLDGHRPAGWGASQALVEQPRTSDRTSGRLRYTLGTFLKTGLEGDLLDGGVDLRDPFRLRLADIAPTCVALMTLPGRLESCFKYGNDIA